MGEIPRQQLALWALAIVGLGMAVEFASLHAFPVPSPWGGYLGLLVAGNPSNVGGV